MLNAAIKTFDKAADGTLKSNVPSVFGDDLPLGEFITKAIVEATYYASFHLRVTVTISAACSECGGSGEVLDKRRKRVLFARKRCPSCKGKPVPQPSIPPFDVAFHPNLIDDMKAKGVPSWA